MTRPVSFERYSIPSGSHGGWAIIFLDSRGVFSTVSDYGNYGYIWSHPGCPFHEFLASIDTSYLSKKLANGAREYRGEETLKFVEDRLKELSANGDTPEDVLYEERVLLKSCDKLYSPEDFSKWSDQTTLPDAHEYACYAVPTQLEMFCKHVWPQFVEQLKQRQGEPWPVTYESETGP